MKLESVRIKNFRTFKDETIFFDNYSCFVGPNGSGKSTVMNALNVFFANIKILKPILANFRLMTSIIKKQVSQLL
ncbi:AAA family ATPase [Aeromonas veronii]|uniref:AAA family ATPase n=1 Tax=Aeromonas veronii TaxID=654 RepID=UPI0019D67E65